MELKMEVTVHLDQKQLMEKKQRADLLLEILANNTDEAIAEWLHGRGFTHAITISSSVISSQGERQ